MNKTIKEIKKKFLEKEIIKEKMHHLTADFRQKLDSLKIEEVRLNAEIETLGESKI